MRECVCKSQDVVACLLAIGLTGAQYVWPEVRGWYSFDDLTGLFYFAT